MQLNALNLGIVLGILLILLLILAFVIFKTCRKTSNDAVGVASSHSLRRLKYVKML